MYQQQKEEIFKLVYVFYHEEKFAEIAFNRFYAKM